MQFTKARPFSKSNKSYLIYTTRSNETNVYYNWAKYSRMDQVKYVEDSLKNLK